VDRLLGEGLDGHPTAKLDFQARLLLFARLTVGYLNPFLAVRNPLQIERVRHMIDLYKSSLRPFFLPKASSTIIRPMLPALNRKVGGCWSWR
jgi:hypothetical protein